MSLPANPSFNESDTALRACAFLESEATMQAVSETKDNSRKDDDVRWQWSGGTWTIPIIFKDILKVRSKCNLVHRQVFSEKLKKTLYFKKTLYYYHNRAISTMEAIEELIAQVKKSVTIDWTLRESARGMIVHHA